MVPAPSGATATCLPVSDERPVDLGAGFTPLVRADRLAAELGLGRAVDQGRHGQSDRILQGPGGLGGADQGPPARVQSRGLCFHRQSRQLGGRPCGPGRYGIGGAHPARPRESQGHHDDDLRGNRDRRRGHLRRRQPAVCGVDERAPELGLCQRQRADLLRRGLQDPRVRDRRAAGLAGSRSRRGPHRLGQPADQGGQGVRRAGQGRPAGRGAACADFGSPGRGVLSGRHRVRPELRCHPARQAQDDRQVAGHRQSGRRLVRPPGDAPSPAARAPR